MMLDMAQHLDTGPVQIGDIAERQDISVKYLEQLIIPLRKAGYVKSVRGPKGGYILAMPPEEITVGEIVNVLEGGVSLTDCIEDPDICEKSDTCLTRGLWQEATQAISERLDAVTLSEMIASGKEV
jgi:Rrf2 family protein